VATHESAGAFAWHVLTNGKARSGGRVYRIDARARPLSKELLFENDGKGISGVSSAVLWQERLYLGQVLANGIGVATRS
jgi:hypothetical protein